MAMTPRTGRTVPSRPRPAVATVRPVYEEFRPMTEWKQDEESNYLLLIYLPGFQREHLKVSTEGRNILRARGERLVAGNKWSRFQEDYPIPEACNVRGIRAKFEGGILTVTIPRKEEAEAAFTKEAPKPTEETHKPSQSPPKAAMKKTYQEAAEEKTRETTPPDQKLLTEKPKISPNEKPVEKSKEETDHQKSTQQKGKLAEVARHAFHTLEEQIDKSPYPKKRKEQIDNSAIQFDPFVGIIEKKSEMRMAPDLVLDNSRRAKEQYEGKFDKKFAQGIKEVKDVFSKEKEVRDNITTEATEKPKSEKDKDEKTQETPPPDQKMLTEKPKISPNEKPVEKSKEETDHQKSTQQKGKLAEVAGHAFYTLREQIDNSVAQFKPLIEREKSKLRVAPDLVLDNLRRAKGQYEEKTDQKFAQRINEVRDHITKGSTEKPKSEEDKGKTEPKEKKTIAASAALSSTDFGLANYKHAVENFMDIKEERQLLVNVGAAVLVIVAFGAYLSYTFK